MNCTHATTNLLSVSELLWVAPECLQESLINSFTGSQKGDVYSFAIILEEIVVRGGPYEKAKDEFTTEGNSTVRRLY